MRVHLNKNRKRPLAAVDRSDDDDGFTTADETDFDTVSAQQRKKLREYSRLLAASQRLPSRRSKQPLRTKTFTIIYNDKKAFRIKLTGRYSPFTKQPMGKWEGERCLSSDKTVRYAFWFDRTLFKHSVRETKATIHFPHNGFLAEYSAVGQLNHTNRHHVNFQSMQWTHGSETIASIEDGACKLKRNKFDKAVDGDDFLEALGFTQDK